MITSAACRVKINNELIIIRVHRHCDFFETMSILHIPFDKNDVEQGFINYNGKKEEFVNRQVAASIAYECGQIKAPIHILYSEDLW